MHLSDSLIFEIAVVSLIPSNDIRIPSTVWKFHGFSITQTLREINFGNSGSAKFAILKHLEALNFDFYEFLHFLKSEIYQLGKPN